MAFPSNSHHKAYVCNEVFEERRPILLVSRPDGDWCFLCGAPHEDSASAYKVVGIGHVLERNPDLAELEDLPIDWEAERERPGTAWIRIKIEQEEQ